MARKFARKIMINIITMGANNNNNNNREEKKNYEALLRKINVGRKREKNDNNFQNEIEIIESIKSKDNKNEKNNKKNNNKNENTEKDYKKQKKKINYVMNLFKFDIKEEDLEEMMGEWVMADVIE
jgi:Zn-dependent M32 family carboxypeptidase